jgi:hypothetical protein
MVELACCGATSGGLTEASILLLRYISGDACVLKKAFGLQSTKAHWVTA